MGKSNIFHNLWKIIGISGVLIYVCIKLQWAGKSISHVHPGANQYLATSASDSDDSFYVWSMSVNSCQPTDSLDGTNSVGSDMRYRVFL